MSEKPRKYAEALFSRLENPHGTPKAYACKISRYISNPNEPDGYRTTTFIKDHKKGDSSSEKGFSEFPVNLFDSSQITIQEDFLKFQKENECSSNESAELEYLYEKTPGFPCPKIEVKSLKTLKNSFLRFKENDSDYHLLIFWKSFNKSSSLSLSDIQKVFQRNPHWQGHVKIFALNHERDIESVDIKNYSNIDIYWVDRKTFKNLKDELCLNFMKIAFCLVHKSKVLWVGRPEDRNWENYINSLIQNIPFNPTVPTLEERILRDFDSRTHKEMMDRGHEKWNQFRLKYDCDPPNLLSVHRFRMEKGCEPVSKFEFSVFGRLLSNYHHAVEEFLTELTEIFPYFNKNIDYIETTIITRGSFCNFCRNQIEAGMIQYLCISCEPRYYLCEKCHTQNKVSYYFYRIGPECENLEQVRNGKDSVFNFIDCYGYPKRSYCRGLGGHKYLKEGEERGNWYKCVTCESVDFCETCFKEWNSISEPFLEFCRDKHLRSHVFATRFY